MIEPLPPPDHIYVGDITQTSLTFNWSRVQRNRSPQDNCCSETVYNIIASNCGSCPNSTTSTTATCRNVTTDGSVCSFAVQTTLCGNIFGQRSNEVTVLLKCKFCMTIMVP